MTRLRSTRAASMDRKVTVQASSQLMDDYVYAADLTGETDLTVVQQPAGGYSLLYLGASGNAISLRQNSQSDTGWSEENLDSGLQPDQVVGVVDASGKFVAFANGGNAAAPDIYAATRQGDGNWSAWEPIFLDPVVPPFRRVMNLAAFTIAGKVELFALLGPSPGHTGDTGLWHIDWSAGLPRWHYIADTDRNIIENCTIAGRPGILFGTIADSDPTKVDLFTVAAPFSDAPAPLAKAVAFTSLAVGTQVDRNSAVFVADQGYSSGVPQIQYLNGSAPGTGFVQIDTAVTATALSVGDAGATPLALFALDEKGELHFIASPVSHDSERNYDFFLRFTSILTATGKDGDAELIGYVPGKGLTRLWQSPADPAGHNGGWTHEAIQYQPANKKKPSQQSTYATTLTFYDDKGVVISDRELHLRSTEIISANVAGEVLVLGPNHPVVRRTDGAGRIRITTPTDTLNVAGLSARLPDLMQVAEDFAISPNYGVQDRLRNITDDDVRKLVPPQFAKSIPHIKQAVKDSMTGIPVVHLVRLRVGAGADLRTPLPVLEQPGPAFRFTVANGQAVHKRLIPAEVAAALAEIRAGAPAGLWESFEDMIEGIRNAFRSAANWVYDYVVEPLTKGFKLALKFVADAVTFVWEGVVDTVEAAFRLAETVFEAVKTTFVRLYEFYGWLLTGDVRKEIWATKTQFEKIFNGGMTTLARLAKEGAPQSRDFFLRMEALVGEKFSEIEKALGSADANQAIDAKPSGGKNTFLEFIEEASSIANWLLDKLTPSFGNWSGVHLDIPDGVLSQAQAVMGQIQSAFVSGIARLIDGFLDRIKRLATSTQEFGNVVLATILGEAKDLILAILRFVGGVIENVLTFFANNLETLNRIVFGARIDISLAQALYDLINPGSSEPLTVLGLVSLVCGFVATTLYRLLFGVAPYPPHADIATTAQGPGADLIVSGVLQATLWCIGDILLDLVPKEKQDAPVPILIFVIFMQVFMQVMAKPAGGAENSDFNTPVEVTPTNAWGFGFASPAFKSIWLLAVMGGWVTGGPRGSVFGSGMLSACGFIGLVLNAVALKEKQPKPALAEIIIGACGPLSAMFKPAYYVPAPTNRIMLGVIDVVSDVGAGIAKVVRGIELNKGDAELAPRQEPRSPSAASA